MSRPFKYFLLAFSLTLIGFLAWKVLFDISSPTTAQPLSASVETPPAQDASNRPVPASEAEPFAAAVQNATSAAALTQTAQTTAEWAAVGVQWDNAMQLMMKVSADHEQYEIAQDRIPTYQANRDYAFTNAGLIEP